jgi:hypothetical protein
MLISALAAGVPAARVSGEEVYGQDPHLRAVREDHQTDLGGGSGLIGLGDRVEPLGGDIQITSPGQGTSPLIRIPIPSETNGREGAQASVNRTSFG